MRLNGWHCFGGLFSLQFTAFSHQITFTYKDKTIPGLHREQTRRRRCPCWSTGDSVVAQGQPWGWGGREKSQADKAYLNHSGQRLMGTQSPAGTQEHASTSSPHVAGYGHTQRQTQWPAGQHTREKTRDLRQYEIHTRWPEVAYNEYDCLGFPVYLMSVIIRWFMVSWRSCISNILVDSSWISISVPCCLNIPWL